MTEKLIELLKSMPRSVQVGAAIVALVLGSWWVYVAKIAPEEVKIRFSTAGQLQAQLAVAHIGEPPSSRTILYDTAAGSSVVEHYGSDDAELVVRSAPGLPSVKLWALHPARAAQMATAQAEPLFSVNDALSLAAPVYAQEPSRCDGRHQNEQPVASWTEDAGNGWTRYWLRFADSCEGYLLCNAATGCGGSINWTRCIH